MKCFSPSVRVSQSFESCAKSISSAVQKEASCFLYISKKAGYWIGKSTQRLGFSLSKGSDFSNSLNCAEIALTGAFVHMLMVTHAGCNV